MKNFLIWDLSDIEDPLYKNEIRANRSLAIALFNITLVSILFTVLNAVGIFKNDVIKSQIVSLSCIFLGLTGALSCFILKGRRKWLKYALLIDLVLITASVIYVLSFYAIIFIVVPILCANRYYNFKYTIIVGWASILILVSAPFLWPILESQANLNLFGRDVELIKDWIDNGNLTYWDYARRGILYIIVPSVLIYLVVFGFSMSNIYRGKELVKDTLQMINEKSKMASELDIANDIQANMLPKIFPPFPSIDAFDIYASMIPAKAVGGDLYDFFLLDDQHVAIVIADVSGKGIPAALFMAITKTLIKNQLTENNNLVEAAKKINNMLCDGNSAGLFVTAWLGVVDLHTGILTYVNAGHNPPVVDAHGECYFLRNKSGAAFGFMENLSYKEYTLEMKPGDRILLYTDGVTESTNEKDEMFGEERLLEYMNSMDYPNNKTLVDDLNDKLKEFSGSREQFDDITMLYFSFHEYMSKWVYEKSFDAKESEYANMNSFIEETMESFNASPKDINAFTIVGEEALTNIVKFAYPDVKDGKILVSLSLDNDIVTLKIADQGLPFDPLTAAEPDINAPIEERPIGGLGIFMIKKMMDTVKYKRKAESNVLTMTKKVTIL